MYFWNSLISLWCSNVAIPLCVLISVFNYTWIVFTHCHHQTQVQTVLHPQHDQHNQTISHETPLNMSRYRKAVASALRLQLVIFAHCLPHGLVEALFTHNGQSSLIFFVGQLTGTLVNVHLSLNSILRC